LAGATLAVLQGPKYNAGLHPGVAAEVVRRKIADGEVIEHQLSLDSYNNWSKILRPEGREPPPEERVVKPGVPFVEATPFYNQEDDIWHRKLALRTLDEAMRGDVSKPLPRPVLFSEDYENYREGKYVKDDCPIA